MISNKHSWLITTLLLLTVNNFCQANHCTITAPDISFGQYVGQPINPVNSQIEVKCNDATPHNICIGIKSSSENDGVYSMGLPHSTSNHHQIKYKLKSPDNSLWGDQHNSYCPGVPTSCPPDKPCHYNITGEIINSNWAHVHAGSHQDTLTASLYFGTNHDGKYQAIDVPDAVTTFLSLFENPASCNISTQPFNLGEYNPNIPNSSSNCITPSNHPITVNCNTDDEHKNYQIKITDQTTTSRQLLLNGTDTANFLNYDLYTGSTCGTLWRNNPLNRNPKSVDYPPISGRIYSGQFGKIAGSYSDLLQLSIELKSDH